MRPFSVLLATTLVLAAPIAARADQPGEDSGTTTPNGTPSAVGKPTQVTSAAYVEETQPKKACSRGRRTSSSCRTCP